MRVVRWALQTGGGAEQLNLGEKGGGGGITELSSQCLQVHIVAQFHTMGKKIG